MRILAVVGMLFGASAVLFGVAYAIRLGVYWMEKYAPKWMPWVVSLTLVGVFLLVGWLLVCDDPGCTTPGCFVGGATSGISAR